MSSGVFVIQADNKLVELNESNYDSEVVLQKLLAEYPNLLSGSQIDPDNPRRWLLISREMSIPQEEGPSSFFVDHLFLDQDAIPTLVEVKRSSDIRIRREVIGQMLDYAANAPQNWPLDTIIAKFEAYCESHEEDTAEILANFLGDDISSDEFWQMAATNLRDGKLRLLFVADEIPIELQRVVEFLNEQMTRTEVLAVEIKQYAGDELKTLIPRVIGQTAEAHRTKRPPKKKWDQDSYFQKMGQLPSPVFGAVARRILEWADPPRVTRVWWGEGRELGSFVPTYIHQGIKHQLFAVYTNGVVEIYFQWYAQKQPFTSENLRKELQTRLNKLEGVEIPDDGLVRRPTIPLTTLNGGDNLTSFFEIFDWVLDTIKAS